MDYYIKVKNEETGNLINGLVWNDNHIQYSQGATPHIYDIVPNQVWAGQEIQFQTILNWANDGDRVRRPCPS